MRVVFGLIFQKSNFEKPGSIEEKKGVGMLGESPYLFMFQTLLQ